MAKRNEDIMRSFEQLDDENKNMVMVYAHALYDRQNLDKKKLTSVSSNKKEEIRHKIQNRLLGEK